MEIDPYLSFVGEEGLSLSITANRSRRPNAADDREEAARNSQSGVKTCDTETPPTPFEPVKAAKGDKMSTRCLPRDKVMGIVSFVE